MTYSYFRCILSFALIWLCASVSLAQTAPASVGISGTIQSDHNEALAGTSIVVVHLPTGTRHTLTTDGLGNFTVPNLSAGGPYAIKATQTGFRPQLLTDVFLSTERPMQLELTLMAEEPTTAKRRPRQADLNNAIAGQP